MAKIFSKCESWVNLGSDEETYVARLREALPCQVLNAGRASDRTASLRARLQKDVLSHSPTVVLIFIGGNDYLDDTPRRKFAEQLDNLVGRVVSGGARVVLVEVPSGIVWNPYAGVYRNVASRYGVILVPESKLRLWFSVELLARDSLAQPLTIDGIHLSPGGAAKVAQWLKPYVLAAFTGLDNARTNHNPGTTEGADSSALTVSPSTCCARIGHPLTVNQFEHRSSSRNRRMSGRHRCAQGLIHSEAHQWPASGTSM